MIPDDLPHHRRQRVEEARRRVEDCPTDLKLRAALGEALFGAGDFLAAIPELQKARQHPEAGQHASRLLAVAFEKIGMHDLAAYIRKGLGEDPPPGEEPPEASLVPRR